MAYSEEVLRRAKARLNQARDQHDREQEARRRDAYARYPRLKELDDRLRATVAEAMAAAFRHGQDPAETIQRLKAENLGLQQEREWILDAAGMEEDYLDEHPFCAKCGGSGYVGAVMCDCLKELCRQEQKKELSNLLGAGKESFDNFRLYYYSTRPDPVYGISPRENMRTVYDLVRNYAQTFSRDARSLLFTGGTGLGKTFLSACVARTVADSGFSVVYDTAVQLFRDFEAAKFGSADQDGDRLTKKYLECDLLIVDDLGTEMTTQFTVSALYTVVNSRLMDRRPTIISTNLSMDEMRRRYTPQIVSRLEGAYTGLLFFGDDIRLLKRDET
jgi:DNA replication protein DnaC